MMEFLNILIGGLGLIPFITIIGSSSAPKKKKRKEALSITISPSSIPADAARKEREIEERKALLAGPKLPQGGAQRGRGTVTSAQRVKGERLRRLRKEGKITEAEFASTFDPEPQPPTAEERAAELSERRPAISEELGTGELVEELQEKIDQPPDIQPQTVSEILGDFFGESRKERAERAEQNRIFVGKLLTGKATKEEIITNAREFGVAAAITGGVVASVLAAPVVAAFAARTVIGKIVTGKLGEFVKIAALLLGAKAIGDFERGEINTMRSIVQGMVEEGERIEADVRNGLDPGFAADRLRAMSDSIDEAERIIKQKGNFNIIYRTGNEYLDDTSSMIKAREAIRRRARAVENIAIIGRAALNPEALMVSVGER